MKEERGERIGEFMVRIGAITPGQVEKILALQKEQPNKRFGEIAIDHGYINEGALNKYLDYKKKERNTELDNGISTI